jgi:hypothetical protein
MMQEFRNEVKQFLTSEVGQATVRGPLALGVASGAFLLSQAVHTSSAAIECIYDDDCGSGRKCDWNCVLWSQGTCVELETQCVPDGS